MTTRNHFDVLVIGSGPAGQRAATQAAKLGRRVAIVERSPMLGGVSANTGTLPSKTARAAILDLTGLGHRSVYGDAYRIKETITLGDVLWRATQAIANEHAVVHAQLRRNGIAIIEGTAAFADPHTLVVDNDDGRRTLVGDQIVIAVGTTPARPPEVDFDDETVIDSDALGDLPRIPRALTVVGGGIIGLEYASMAAALGVHVTVVERREHLLEFVDDEVVEALQFHLRDLGLTFRLGEHVARVERTPDRTVVTRLESGKRIVSDVVLYAAGRQGATAGLGLDDAGLAADARGRIEVDATYRTAQPHIFAVGDVIGGPALAATGMEQGRLAGLAASGVEPHAMPELLPYGIYTIPEISMVGATERRLTDTGTPYVVGIARYRELARGAIEGDRNGMLKVLVHADSRRLLGVHVFGTAATEIVHIGQTAMAAGLPIDHFVDAVFNYPTFADAFKVAALDAANQLNQIVVRARRRARARP